MNFEDKVLDVLKERTLTNREIARLTKLKINDVRQITLKLRTLGKIKVEEKRGREYLYSSKGLENDQSYLGSPTNGKYVDGLLFTFISNSGKVNYDQLVNFYSTLGMTEYIVFFRVLRNLQKGFIEVTNVPDGFYSKIISFFVQNFKKVKDAYPLTMKFQEAFLFFKPLGISNIEDFINDLKKLSKDFPEFVNINSSEIGRPADLLTFNQIFVKQIKFITSGAWRIS